MPSRKDRFDESGFVETREPLAIPVHLPAAAIRVGNSKETNIKAAANHKHAQGKEQRNQTASSPRRRQFPAVLFALSEAQVLHRRR